VYEVIQLGYTGGMSKRATFANIVRPIGPSPRGRSKGFEFLSTSGYYYRKQLEYPRARKT